MNNIEFIEIKVKRKYTEQEAISKIKVQLGENHRNSTYDLHIYNIQKNPRWLRYIRNLVGNNINKLYYYNTKRRTKGKGQSEVLETYSKMSKTLENNAKTVHVK